MKIDHPFLTACAGWAGATWLRFLRRTMDWRIAYTDPATDIINPQSSGRFIYIAWHECVIMPIVMRSLP